MFNFRRDFVLGIFIYSFFLQCFHIVEEPSPVTPAILTTFVVGFYVALSNLRARLLVIDVVSGIFFLYLILTGVWAPDSRLVMIRLSGILFLAAAYFITRALTVDMPREKIINVIQYVGIVALVFSWAYYVIGIHLAEDIGSYFADFENPGFYGLYRDGILPRMRGTLASPGNLAIGAVFLYFFYSRIATRFRAWGIILSLLTIIFTMSITALAAIAMVEAIAFMTSKGAAKRMVWWILLASCILALVVIFVPDEILADIYEGRMERVATGSGRDELFAYTVERMADHMFFGFGLNQARILYVNLRNFQSTHNSFLEAVVEGGMVGGALFVAAWGSLLLFLKRISKIEKTDFYFLTGCSMFLFNMSNLITYAELQPMIFGLLISLALTAEKSDSRVLLQENLAN